jgi:diguanylate cyclase (GGDEF)-like protein
MPTPLPGGSFAERSHLEALQRVAGVEVLAEIGRGAHAVVYQVRHPTGEYALKVFLKTGLDEAKQLAFRREAALLTSVNHRAVARVHEVGVADGRPYLLMDLVTGQRLSHLLQSGPLGEHRVIELGIGVTEALAAAHRAGLVHRDVKPDNIIIGPDGSANLVDFGLAMRVDNTLDGLTAGTLAYGAPEQSGVLRRAVDGRADLYSLGIVLFECATGVVPFTAADVGELLRLHAVQPAPDARSIRPELSAGLAAVLTRLLAKDPDDRYQSAAGLLAALRRLAADPDAAGVLATLDEAPQLGRRDAPLVGRDAELAVLRARWEKAREGTGGVALILAPAGGGKTRLAQELVAEVDRAGYVVFSGKGTRDDGSPLAALRGAVDDYVRVLRRRPAGETLLAQRRLVNAAGAASSVLRNLSPELGNLLPASEVGAELRHEQFAAAVAGFFGDLSRLSGGLVLHLDDVQWLDDVTRRVLQRIADDVVGAPLLIVATARDDEASRSRVAAFRSAMGPILDTELTLSALDGATVADLVAALSGGMTIDPTTASRLAARSAGNPFTLLAYIDAITDAGLLEPRWGTWRIDTDGLDHLDLSGDVTDLILERVDTLEAEARRVLGVGAVIGYRFEVDLLAGLTGIDRERVSAILIEASWQHLIERHLDGQYAFLHDRIHEALLSQFDAARLRMLHDRVADALEGRQSTHRDGFSDPQLVYAIAYHRLRGEVERDPGRIFDVGWAAGRLALADHAPGEALSFLERAAAAAHAARITMSAGFLYALGVAYHQVGRFEDAVETLDRALAASSDPFERATILYAVVRVHDNTWNMTDEAVVAERALSELGRAVPKNLALLTLTSLWWFAVGGFITVTRVGYGGVSGRERETFQLLAQLNEAFLVANVRDMHGERALLFGLRGFYLASRLGRQSAESLSLHAGLSFCALAIGLRRLGERVHRNAVASALELGDFQAVAQISWEQAMARHMSGVDTGDSLQEVAREHRRWLDTGHYLDCFHVPAWDWILGGDTARMDELFRIRRQAALASGQARRFEWRPFDVALPAMRGQAAEAASLLQGFMAVPDIPQWERIDVLLATLHFALEQRDLGAVFDDAAAEFDAMKLMPMQLLWAHQAIYVYLAYGRLEQCRAATSEAERRSRLQAARREVRRLRLLTRRPMIAAHYRVVSASLAEVRGRPERALAKLAKADPVLRAVDAPLIAYEAACIRARALRRLGVEGETARQAAYAMSIAQHHQWGNRMRWLLSEFDDVLTDVSPSPGMSPLGRLEPEVVASGVYRQRLAALQQVSRAASRVLDPDQLGRVALDETIGIVGAERAFLFLVDEYDRLVPQLGRDAAGRDLDAPTAYAMTLVERSHRTREPLVVTGSDEGEALGSRSMGEHGLRSIMVVPVRLENRILGVMYLDSRIAKGIFTMDDVGVLTAITNHVAAALETARAARLEAAIEAAQRKRELAELLRESMAELSGILEPEVVLARLVSAAQRTFNGSGAWLLAQGAVGSEVTLLDSRLVSRDGRNPALAATRLAMAPDLAEVLDTPRPTVFRGGGPWPIVLAQVTGSGQAPPSWLVVPLRVRQRRLGALVLAATSPEAFDDAEVEIAAAMIEQGMIAYESAQLFAQARFLATVDDLTQLANRRHVLEAANRELARARRHAEPLSAVMIDIDHFKRINDAHGHQAGDEVIRAVAERIRRHARLNDMAGRYGGEEFVLLVPGDAVAATAIAEQLRGELAENPIITAAGPIGVTISAGVAFLTPADTTPQTLLARADNCLYRAKNSGRNRVAVQDPVV